MRLRRLAGWAGEVAITLGVLLLLVVAWQLWWTDVVSNRDAGRVVATLEQEFARAGPTPGRSCTRGRLLPPPACRLAISWPALRNPLNPGSPPQLGAHRTRAGPAATPLSPRIRQRSSTSVLIT